MAEKKKILIVGGVAGGASAATRARRLSETDEIIIFERGPYVSFANCGLPYHVGGTITERERLLVTTPEALRARFELDVRVKTEVIAIHPDRKVLELRELDSGRVYEETYDALILSPGAKPFIPPITGVDLPGVLTLRNMTDMDRINKRVEQLPQGGRALVIGGGYIGLEMAEALRERDWSVALVEKLPQVMGPADPEMAAPLHDELIRQGIDLYLESAVEEFCVSSGDKLNAKLDTGQTLEVDLAICAVGVVPEVNLARDAGLKIGERGGIVVDAAMQTSDAAIWAVGDAIEVVDFVTDSAATIPLAGPANRQGRIAADNINGRSSRYKKTQGTAICKVFDLAIAMTGASEKTLKRAGTEYKKVYLHPNQHAGYYPGATPMSLKLIFAPEDGRLLGAQAVGLQGVDKRIDVLAVSIRAGLTVYDLEELELCYAPPYGSAKDPVNFAGFIASNFLRGDVQLRYVEELKDNDEFMIVDVRPEEVYQLGHYPGSINIPLTEIRGRLEEFSTDREVVLNCNVGMDSYNSSRILTQHGINCSILSGGMKTYKASTAQWPHPQPSNNAGSSANPTGKTDNQTQPPASDTSEVNVTIDACGLQCPGPILKVREVIDTMQPGQTMSIAASDPGFGADIGAWCRTAGHELVDVKREGAVFHATICKASETATANASAPSCSTTKDFSKNKTMVVFSGDLDRALASFIIANGAAAMGNSVTMFFTFWGLTILRKDQIVPTQKNFVERAFGWILPRGARKLTLSKMHFGGLGTAMMKKLMQDKGVASLPKLIASAQKNGVRLVACSMSMDLMGIRREELIDGIEEAGVASYLEYADQSNMNLFI